LGTPATGLSFVSHLTPGLPPWAKLFRPWGAGFRVSKFHWQILTFVLTQRVAPWAKLFRPARRDWRSGQSDAEQIDKLRTDKIPTLAKRRLGWGTRALSSRKAGLA
jgi:hypothetical protein